jgi:hypothetical protein
MIKMKIAKKKRNNKAGSIRKSIKVQKQEHLQREK